MARTKEEKREWYSKMNGLAAKIREMDEEKRQALAEQYGTVTAEGRTLSPFNCVYLAEQAGRPVLQVGGCRQWGRVGRAVVKGQKAVGYIWVPLKPRNGAGNAAPSSSDEKEKGLRFKLIPMFEVTQTVEVL